MLGIGLELAWNRGKYKEPPFQASSSPLLKYEFDLCCKTLPVPFCVQVYKWVSMNCHGNLTECHDIASYPRKQANSQLFDAYKLRIIPSGKEIWILCTSHMKFLSLFWHFRAPKWTILCRPQRFFFKLPYRQPSLSKSVWQSLAAVQCKGTKWRHRYPHQWGYGKICRM